MNRLWKHAQSWELQWHGDCVNSLNEELKQLVYAEKMGLISSPTPKTPYNFDLNGISILDIGGGAYSLLLKCVNYDDSAVADPLMDKFPQWIRDRYESVDITPVCSTGEDLEAPFVYSECWVYNCLQHTQDPKRVIDNALELGKVVRIFEWIETGTNIGHLHNLTEKDLNEWLGGEGKVENINRNGAVGKCYYGIFKGKHYND